MSLVFSGITPHPPLVIENIGKDKSKEVVKTKKGLLELEKDLYLTRPDTIIVLSSQAREFEEVFTLNFSDNYESNFEEFGDLKTKDEWKGDQVLTSKIQDATNEANIPLRLITKEKLDHGTSIPLHGLTRHMDKPKVISIGHSDLSKEAHLKLGKILRKVIIKSSKRIAVVASGDMSHTLSDESPAGFHDDGVVFNNRLKKFLENNDVESIKKMDKDVIKNAQEFIYKPLLITIGVLNGIDYKFEKHSYQESFGVGYLVANMKLP